MTQKAQKAQPTNWDHWDYWDYWDYWEFGDGSTTKKRKVRREFCAKRESGPAVCLRK